GPGRHVSGDRQPESSFLDEGGLQAGVVEEQPFDAFEVDAGDFEIDRAAGSAAKRREAVEAHSGQVGARWRSDEQAGEKDGAQLQPHDNAKAMRAFPVRRARPTSRALGLSLSYPRSNARLSCRGCFGGRGLRRSRTAARVRFSRLFGRFLWQYQP